MQPFEADLAGLVEVDRGGEGPCQQVGEASQSQVGPQRSTTSGIGESAGQPGQVIEGVEGVAVAKVAFSEVGDGPHPFEIVAGCLELVDELVEPFGFRDRPSQTDDQELEGAKSQLVEGSCRRVERRIGIGQQAIVETL